MAKASEGRPAGYAQRNVGSYWRPALAWPVIIYLSSLVGYGTFAWIERASELWSGGNSTAATSLVVVGAVASLLTPAVVIGVRMSSSKMLVRSSALYGLTLSILLLIFLAVAYNI